jgi:hypothetical protein
MLVAKCGMNERIGCDIGDTARTPPLLTDVRAEGSDPLESEGKENSILIAQAGLEGDRLHLKTAAVPGPSSVAVRLINRRSRGIPVNSLIAEIV